MVGDEEAAGPELIRPLGGYGYTPGASHQMEVIELIAGPGVSFETKDSGVREEYPSGMRRDTQQGKPRYDLLDIPFLTRWAGLMARGADKYGENNWRLAESPEELSRFKQSAFRHFIQWFSGETDEDHAAAVAFNIAAAESVKRKLDDS